MPPDYGRDHLAGLALNQVEQAERDPRADHEVGIRDAFYAATGEAENLRFLAQLGLAKLAQQPIEEGTPDAHHRQARWAQSYMAQLMIDADFPYLNAMTLVAIYSAVDAMIESLVPSRVEAIVAMRLLAVLEQLDVDLDSPETRQRFETAMNREVLAGELAKIAKKTGRVGSGGLSRYERHLQVADLAGFPDRAFPEDLDVALKEISALRDVLVHSGGRVDAKAVSKAPTLPARGYLEGCFVRIGRDDYRTYSAALFTFAEEVLDRMLLQVGQERPNSLSDWRDNATLNA